MLSTYFKMECNDKWLLIMEREINNKITPIFQFATISQETKTAPKPKETETEKRLNLNKQTFEIESN